MSADRLNPLLVQLTRVLASTPAQQPMAMRLCRAFSHVLGTEGGSVAVGVEAQERAVLCATDENAGRVEDLQEVLAEGPCLDVARSGTATSGNSFEHQRTRWPLFFDLLERDGEPLCLHVFPLKPQQSVLGTVCVYRTDSEPLAQPVEDAQLLANAVGVALLGDVNMGEVSEERWVSRDRIDQATGMVIAQLRLSARDARAVLRAHAFAHATTLGEVSGWVLDRRLNFKNADSEDGSGS